MNNKNKKYIAPIIVSIFVVAYYLFFFGILITEIVGFWKYILGIVPIFLSIAMIKVCLERIKEIREGEDDDLSKY